MLKGGGQTLGPIGMPAMIKIGSRYTLILKKKKKLCLVTLVKPVLGSGEVKLEFSAGRVLFRSDPFQITNKLMHVLSVAKVGILLDFTNFGNMGLSHKLMLSKSL